MSDNEIQCPDCARYYPSHKGHDCTGVSVIAKAPAIPYEELNKVQHVEPELMENFELLLFRNPTTFFPPCHWRYSNYCGKFLKPCNKRCACPELWVHYEKKEDSRPKMTLEYKNMTKKQKMCYDAYDGKPPKCCSNMKIPDEDACKRCPARICNKGSWCPL